MKLVSRSHRILAMLLGIAVLATLVFQIMKDGRKLEMKNIQNIQSIKK